MKRHYGLWILFPLAIAVIVGFSIWAERLPKQTAMNLAEHAKIAATTPMGVARKDSRDKLKVVIAVDTSYTMAESYPMMDDNMNLVNSTAFLINLLASSPDTEVGLLVMSNAYDQESGKGPSNYKRDGVDITQEVFTEHLSDDDAVRLSFLQPINRYVPVSKELHSDLNHGVERIKKMIDDDWDDEGVRYAVLIITDAKTKENLEDTESKFKELYGRGVEIYFLLPENLEQGNMLGTAITPIPHTHQLVLQKNSFGVFGYDDLMGAYLDFFSKIKTWGDKSMSYEKITGCNVTPPKEDVFRYRFKSDGYHYGVSASAPAGYRIWLISVEDPGSAKREYLFEWDEERKKDDQTPSDMVFIKRDIDTDVRGEFTYYVDICAYESSEIIAPTEGIKTDEDYKEIAAPIFHRINLNLEDFCVTVSADGCVLNKQYKDDINVYTINHSKPFEIEMALMLQDNDIKRVIPLVYDYEVYLGATLLNPNTDKRIRYNADKSTINIGFDKTGFTEKQELVFTIKAASNGSEIKKFKINIIDDKPMIDVKHLEEKREKGIFYDLENLRIDVTLNKNGKAEIPLDGWAVDPEGQNVEYYLPSGMAREGKYRFTVRKDADKEAYFLDVEKRSCLLERNYPIQITLFFRDSNKEKNKQVLDIMIIE